MNALLDLAERVEAYDPRLSLDNRADEMSLELAVAQAAGRTPQDARVARGSVTGYISGDGVGGYGTPSVPRYLRSLDAAMSLAGEDAVAILLEALAIAARYFVEFKDDGGHIKKALPRFIVAVSLRALAAQGEMK